MPSPTLQPKQKKKNTLIQKVSAPVPVTFNVNQQLLHYFSLEGADHIFQIPGAAFMTMLNELAARQKEFKSIICKHETGAAFMADGFYRTTGKLGVVMVTSGPGATNALTGVMNANNDGSAVLLFTGEIAQAFFGTGFLQEGIDTALNVDAVYSASTSYSAMIQEPLESGTIIKTAMRSALSVPRRAVHLSLPANVGQLAVPTKDMQCKSPTEYRAAGSHVSEEQVQPLLQALAKAKRPCIFLGNGCRSLPQKTIKALIDLAEYYAVPVMSTPDGKGIFPESHEMALRIFGCASTLWPYYWLNAPKGENPLDFMLVIGSSLGGLATEHFSPLIMPANGAFYHVDAQAGKLGRAYAMRQGIVGEAESLILNMQKLMAEKPNMPDQSLVNNRKKTLSKIKKDYPPFEDPKQYNSNAAPIAPAALMRCIQNTLPKNREVHLFVDAGNCVGWCNHYLMIDKPWNIYSALSMGPMGFGVCAVIGGKMGRPDAVGLTVTGDGAFMMHGSEVSTAAHYGVGAIWIVLHDNNLRMVSQGMKHFFPNVNEKTFDKLYELGNPNLKLFAEGLGATTYEVNTTEQANLALAKAITEADQKKRPQVIIANIDSKPVPPYYNPLYQATKP